jgi:dolichol-phosphate mannosyltransferase
VTASPYHPDGKVEGVSGYRILLSRGSSLLYRILVDWWVCTYTSLFRAYRREVIENITFECNGYRAVTEILVKAILQGYRVAEYPTTLHKRTLGSSKVKLLRTIIDHMNFQALVLFHRLSLKPMV